MPIYKSTIQLLRLPFSINLLPIFLWALYNSKDAIQFLPTLFTFLVIHFLLYPSSNAYNSFQDKDEGSIAGLEKPPQATRQLYHASLLLDALVLIGSAFVNLSFLAINLIYILISRAYSYKGIRIKKYAVLGFIVISVFQGAISYLNMIVGIQDVSILEIIHSPEFWLQGAVASLFVGAIYPITQIYQHEEDRKNGDLTLSMKLGYRGSFIFSGAFFALSILLIIRVMSIKELLIFGALMLIPIVFFLYWAYISWNNDKHINFRNTMKLLLFSAVSMNLAFLIILIWQYI